MKMSTENSKVSIFIDNEAQPAAVLDTPVQFELDTHKLIDREHTLTIVSKSPAGREGIRRLNSRSRTAQPSCWKA